MYLRMKPSSCDVMDLSSLESVPGGVSGGEAPSEPASRGCAARTKPRPPAPGTDSYMTTVSWGEKALSGRDRQHGVYRRVTVLDLDLFRLLARLAMLELHLVLAVREPFDFKVAILASDGIERMVQDADVAEHPRMDIAFEPEELLRLAVHEFQRLSLRGLALVHFLVA